MKTRRSLLLVAALLAVLHLAAGRREAAACSTFKLEVGDELLCGHNLNEGDIGVPGLVFVNKRGVFKQGRTWDELQTRDRANPSDFRWISRYGSVTFNVFARDFPDGGLNEVGLYIWEMNETAEYPDDEGLPRLNKMNWMQYVLDSCATVDDALACARAFAIDGRSWHYFVGDATGDCAALAFLDGKPVVNRGPTLPVPGLFNTPYDRELEILKYYEGFGGFRPMDMDEPTVPRFVKTAAMLRDADPNEDAVDYGLEMLDNLTVYDAPEWSVLFDVVRMDIYYKTRISPSIKRFSMAEIDFADGGDTLILNMDGPGEGDMIDRLHVYTNEEMRTFLKDSLVPILPEDFFTSGGLTVDEYCTRFASHADTATEAANRLLAGTWTNGKQIEEGDQPITLILSVGHGCAVSGEIVGSSGRYAVEHLALGGDRLDFTISLPDKGWEWAMVEATAFVEDDHMELSLSGIETEMGTFTIYREDS